MLRPSQMSLVSLRELVISAGPFVLLTLVLLWLAYLILDPTPPTKVVMATRRARRVCGVGKRYATDCALRHFGRVRTTAARRKSPSDARSQFGVDIALCRAGGTHLSSTKTERPSLPAAYFLEPVWLFYRTMQQTYTFRDTLEPATLVP